ncbi:MULTISPECIES: NCS1 family nucleobase:cation symporter-1 [Amycolatopsis]|uniref:Nucleobase:cation symporter-1, NCS1 family protein n=1 Tax=Amycolatopsis bullii TaxID=941987 RepID=A0ABQ3KPT2_9PSEU|nr:NCS1 family nucleobase:cation symporter-1 [Amycolatopsis bullii]GHG41914.1 nucleobase:cation symporter-1, NCS1 family protein [Amycolatopsis bullii]
MTAAPLTEPSQETTTPPDPRLWNEDLAPAKERRWKVYDIFALWMSDVHNLGNYTFAAGLFVLGLSAWQVFTALLFGFIIIYAGMNLMGRIGQRTGVPFPVVARISFGTFGANLPALIRAIIAIFWYGIQTYLASVAITLLVLAIDPGLKPLTEHGFLGLHALGWMCFVALWAVQALILTRGMESVRKFQDWCGPAIWVVMIALAVWILAAGHWNISFTSSPKQLSTGEQIRQWFGAAGLILATYGTLMLNFCDFSRFAPDQKTVKRGNFWGLPINSTAFALLSVIVTAGSMQVFGEAITDPAELLAKVHNTPVLIVGALTFAIATMGVNIVANFVSPAYDLANIWPKRITFTIGGMISAVAALCVLPWKLYSSPAVVNYFLGGLGAFLGPLFGIMIVDYYLIRRGKVDVAQLFVDGGSYPRVNPRALVTFFPTAALSAVIALVPFFAPAAPYSWFIGTASSAALYYVVSRKHR